VELNRQAEKVADNEGEDKGVEVEFQFPAEPPASVIRAKGAPVTPQGPEDPLALGEENSPKRRLTEQAMKSAIADELFLIW
jgi:hypothetical protein